MNDYALLLRFMLLTLVVAAALLLPGKGHAMTVPTAGPVLAVGTPTHILPA